MPRSVTALFLLAALALPAQAQSKFKTEWERTTSGSGIPSWFDTSDSKVRGLAFGVVEGNARVYVASQTPSIRIIEAATGADVSELDMGNIASKPGYWKLNDVEVSDDGVIIACNATLNASGAHPFICYLWSDESSAPKTILTYATTGADRLGDKITVTGSCATNSATLWAASGTSANVHMFATNNNCESFSVSSVVAVSAVMGPTPDVYPDFSGAGGFFGTGHGNPVYHYSASGHALASTRLVGTSTVSLEAFTSGERNYLAVFDHRGAGNPGYATILDVTDGLASATAYGATPGLGTAADATSGDISVRDNGDGTFTVYILETNNGLGAYTTIEPPLPVELVSFEGIAGGSTATLRWMTAGETNNAGFDVQQRLGNDFQTLGFVAGHGTTVETNTYVFEAKNLTPGRHTFRLVQRDFDGTISYSDEVEIEIAGEAVFMLSGLQPNPTRGDARLNVYVARTQPVSVEMYDAVGRQVAVLFNGVMAEGTTPLQVDASALPAGLYVIRARGEHFAQTQQLTVIR